MFLSTRGYHYTYNYLVKSSKKNCETLIKQKIDLLIFNLKKLPSIKFLIFATYIIFSGKNFMKDRVKIKFEKIEIGRFILAKTFCEFECYTNKFRFYLVFIKCFLLAGRIIKTCNYYYQNYDVKGVYVDHCMYMNGIIFSFFAHKSLPVYTNNYPLGMFFVDFKKNKNKHLLRYENALRIITKKKINNHQKKKAKTKLSHFIKKKNFINYLVGLNYEQLDGMDYKNFDYVIFAHAFTDGQLGNGYSGFENSLEWLEFTLDSLINNNKKVLIKPHPNFYNDKIGQQVEWDKRIYDIVIKKYNKYNNLVFLRKPIHNYLLLKKLDKNCVLITQYGSVIFEAAYMKFKSICTTKNIFDKNFKISNMWNDKNEYLKLLNTNYLKLRKPNKDDLLELIYAMFFYHNSEYNINFYDNIIRKNLKLNEKEYKKLFAVPARGLITNYQVKKLKTSNSMENKIINRISRSIHQVRG